MDQIDQMDSNGAEGKQETGTIDEAFSSKSSRSNIRSCCFRVSICNSRQDRFARSLEKRALLG